MTSVYLLVVSNNWDTKPEVESEQKIEAAPL